LRAAIHVPTKAKSSGLSLAILAPLDVTHMLSFAVDSARQVFREIRKADLASTF
jgi:hypothetical protein